MNRKLERHIVNIIEAALIGCGVALFATFGPLNAGVTGFAIAWATLHLSRP